MSTMMAVPGASSPLQASDLLSGRIAALAQGRDRGPLGVHGPKAGGPVAWPERERRLLEGEDGQAWGCLRAAVVARLGASAAAGSGPAHVLALLAAPDRQPSVAETTLLDDFILHNRTELVLRAAMVEIGPRLYRRARALDHTACQHDPADDVERVWQRIRNQLLARMTAWDEHLEPYAGRQLVWEHLAACEREARERRWEADGPREEGEEDATIADDPPDREGLDPLGELVEREDRAQALREARERWQVTRRQLWAMAHLLAGTKPAVTGRGATMLTVCRARAAVRFGLSPAAIADPAAFLAEIRDLLRAGACAPVPGVTDELVGQALEATGIAMKPSTIRTHVDNFLRKVDASAFRPVRPVGQFWLRPLRAV